MELSFHYSAPPYAQIATLIDASSKDAIKNIKLTLVKDAQHKITLTSPNLPGTSIRLPSLQGASIFRYFAREGKSSLYNESNLLEAVTSDGLLSLINDQPVIEKIFNVIETRKAIEKPLLGDIAIYFYLKQLSIKDESIKVKLGALSLWSESIEKLIFVKETISLLDEFVKDADKPQKMVIPDIVTPIPQVPGADTKNNVLDIFRSLIADQISKLANVSVELVWTVVDYARNPDLGDFAIAIPQLRLKGNPAQLAAEFVKNFKTNEFITSVSNVGPFLNFRISPALLTKLLLERISHQKLSFGTNQEFKGKKVIVEFGSPNIAKPFHAGHLRSPIIGGFISNVHEACGWDVMRWNYLGDWGKQFGLLAVGWDEFGSEDKLKEDAIKHLYDVYVMVNQAKEENPKIDDDARAFFKRMEDGDEKALAIWRRFKDLSIERLKETYARLNIHFDTYSGEADVKSSSMEKTINILEQKGVTEMSEGSLVLDLLKYKLPKTVLRKRDGTSLYITRDIGGVMQRYENHKFDKLIYVVAKPQELHFQQTFKAVELMEMPFSGQLAHIPFGHVNGMSTRKGTVVFLEDILDTARETMHEVMRKNESKYAQIENPDHVADIIGISAVMIQDMSARRVNDYDFNWNRVTTFEGNTGPYLQYAHSRLSSVERKGGLTLDTTNADVSYLSEKAAHDLLWVMAQYPDIIKTSYRNLEPSTIVTYCFKLAHAVAAAWDTLWVVNQPKDVAMARLYMYVGAKYVLGNALRLLGLKPLDRM